MGLSERAGVVLHNIVNNLDMLGKLSLLSLYRIQRIMTREPFLILLYDFNWYGMLCRVQPNK